MSKNKKKTNIENKSRSVYFTKRIFAFLVDWYVSAVILNLFTRIALINLKLGNEYGDIKEFTNEAGIVIISLALVVSFIYYVLIPHLGKKSQTILMKLSKIEIVDMGGNKPSFISLLKRYYLGSFVIQGVLYSSFDAVVQTIAKMSGIQDLSKFDYFIAIPTIIVIAISCWMAYKDKKYSQTLQDKIAKTKVIEV